MLRLTRKLKRYAELIPCACGHCNELISTIDKWGRPRRYLRGHNMSVENNPKYNGGLRIDMDGYIHIKNPTHPFADKAGYVIQYRLIMEKYLSKTFNEIIYLDPKEEIHHINGNKNDNRITNLMLFPNSAEHVKFERTLDKSNCVCLLCNSNKTSGKRWYRYLDGYICNKCYKKERKIILPQL